MFGLALKKNISAFDFKFNIRILENDGEGMFQRLILYIYGDEHTFQQFG